MSISNGSSFRSASCPPFLPKNGARKIWTAFNPRVERAMLGLDLITAAASEA